MRCRFAVSAFAIMPVVGFAQGTPGTNVRVSVTVSSLSSAADTVSIAYRIVNLLSSAEPVFSFTVEAPSPPVTVASPTPHSSWDVVSRHVDRPIAGWTALDTSLIAVGKTSPELSFRAVGIPGIVDAHVIGYYPPPELNEDSLRVETDPLVTNAIHIRVVGVDVLDRSLGAAAFITRLRTLVAESCTLGWVRSAGICKSLQAKVDAALSAQQRGQRTAATNQLDALRNELNAQRGKQLDDNAYHLLRANAEYVQTRL